MTGRNGSPFHRAAGLGRVEICKLFIDILINKNPWDDNGNTPIYMAARSGHLEVCTQLMEKLHDKNPKIIMAGLHFTQLRGLAIWMFVNY